MMPLWSGFLLCLSLCLDVGIVNVAILRTALQRGGRAEFLVELGSSVGGDLLYFGLAAVGALAVLSRWGGRRLVRALSLVSALLFLYFAVTIFGRGLAALRGGGARLG